MSDMSEKKKIMVIDDSKFIVAIVGNILQENGFDVTVLTESEKSLELIEEVMPDVIILDIIMPNVDGLTICKMVKENTKLKDIKIIIFSSKKFEVDRKKAMAVGADGFISKPVVAEKLLSRINEIMGGSEGVME